MADETLRETLEKSYDKAAETAEESGGPPQSSEEPVRTPTEEKAPTDAPAKEGTEEKPAVRSGAEPDPTEEGGESAKGDDKDKQRSTNVEEDEIKTAPSSWRAAERELWASASPELRRVVARREKEVQKLIEKSGNEGRFRASFEQVIAPFQKYIKSSGGNPFRSIHNLMSTAATLQDGSAHQKASLVTDMINSFKVDVELLDQMLARSVKPKGPLTADDIRGVVREEVRSSIPQQQMQQMPDVSKDVNAFFKDPKNEYANDVALDMADLLEMAGRRGEKMTMEEAYERACMLNPDVQKLKQKKLQDELSKKKTASSSLPSNTSTNKVVPKVTATSSLRDDIEAAISHLSSR